MSTLLDHKSYMAHIMQVKGMTTKNIYKILLYISSKDRDTIINEISEYIDNIDDFSACSEENIDDFLSSRQRGTEYDKVKNSV